MFYTGWEECRNVVNACTHDHDAAKAIGHSSRSQLYRLIKDGSLDDFIRYDNGRRLIELNGLAAAVREATQQRSNSVTVLDGDTAMDWDGVAAIANDWLDVSAWGKPPWTPTRWASLYWCCVDAMAEMSSLDPVSD